MALGAPMNTGRAPTNTPKPPPRGPSGPSGTSSPNASTPVPGAPTPPGVGRTLAQVTLGPISQWADGSNALNAAQYANDRSFNNVRAGQADARYSAGMSDVNADAAFDTRYLNNNIARHNSDIGLLGAKIGNLNSQYDISGRRFSDQALQNNELAGFNTRTFNSNAQALGERGEQATRGLGINDRTADSRFMSARDAATLTFDRQTRQSRSDATARGGTLTQGFGDDLREIGRGRDNTMSDATRTRDLSKEGNRLTYDGQRTDLDQSGRNNQLTFDRGVSDINASNRSNQRTYDSDTSNFELGKATLKREDDYLVQLGNDYGVDKDRIKDTLQRGARNMGLDYADLMAAITNDSNQAGTDFLARGQAIGLQVLQAGMNAGANVPLPAMIASSTPSTPRQAGDGPNIPLGNMGGATTPGGRGAPAAPQRPVMLGTPGGV